MLRLGSIGRTTIDVDFSFFILVIFFVVMNYDAQAGIQYALIWIPVLFVSVLIHELAHAGMIALFGFGSSQIVLGGMGGVTINRRQARPWQDMLISVAGPAASFAIWLISIFVLMSVPAAQTDLFLQALLPRLAWANRAWGLLNMIPVPPLDGGHATRDFFRTFLDERRAFIAAIWIGIPVGAAVAIYMLIVREIFVAVLIAWFVYLAFQQWVYFREHGVPGD